LYFPEYNRDGEVEKTLNKEFEKKKRSEIRSNEFERKRERKLSKVQI